MDIPDVYEAKRKFFAENFERLAPTVGHKAIHAFTAVELFVDYLTSQMYREEKNGKDM